MATEDASSAEMRRLSAHGDADPLALDDDTVERLLTGTLPPAQAPAGYAKVAQLLRAAAAAPTPEELAGQGAVLAELRAAARARSTAGMAPGRPWRRRRTGLAVVVVVGALVTGGAAGAATGHLPGAVRDAARAIIGSAENGAPSSPTTPGQPPASASRITDAGGAGPQGPQPGGTTGPGPGSTGAGPVAGPAVEGLCQAFAAGNGAQQGDKLSAKAFADLAEAAGGEDKVAAFCEDLLPGDQKFKDPQQPEDPGSSGTGGQGSPPASTGGQGGRGGPRPETGRAP